MPDDFRFLNRGAPEVDNVVADVLAEVRHLLGAPNVPLADFDEASAWRQRGETRGDEIPGQRIQDDIDSATAGSLQYFPAEIKAAGIHDVWDAQFPQKGALPIASGSRKDLRAGALCYLYGREPYAAGGGMNQDPVACADLR
jgi:hypothetical protein